MKWALFISLALNECKPLMQTCMFLQTGRISKYSQKSRPRLQGPPQAARKV